MIHAFLFIRGIREPNGGHGPNFHKIMNDINKVAGTQITVYHTFHDEVDVYKVHVWRCNGICQHRRPFYGWVKRTSNRAPGPNDLWWSKHHESCGGTFQKVSGPEPKRPGKKAKIEVAQPKIDSFWGQNAKPTKMEPPKTNVVPKATVGTGNLSNVRGFNDLNKSGKCALFLCVLES